MPGEKKLKVVGLAALVFFSVAGSPIGSEWVVKAGGPLLTVIGFIVFPIVWGIPEGLITAELSTALPQNGGYVIWVSTAFGERAGIVEGLLKFFAGVLDNCLYPILIRQYLDQAANEVCPHVHYDCNYPPDNETCVATLQNCAVTWDCDNATSANATVAGSNDPCKADDGVLGPCDPGGRAVVAMAVVLLSLAAWRGLEIVGTVSSVVIVLTLMPFAVMVFMGLLSADGAHWGTLGDGPGFGEMSADDKSNYVVNLFWSLNYWDAVSTFASEVDRPVKTFPRALALAGVMVVTMYLSVLGTAIVHTPCANLTWETRSQLTWKMDGFGLETSGQWVGDEFKGGGQWLQKWIVAAAAIAGSGLFLADLSEDTFLLEGMAELRMLPEILVRRNAHGIPAVALIAQALFIFVFTIYRTSVEELLAYQMISYCFSQVLEFVAFVRLRTLKPDMPRPFLIPGGTVGAAALIAPALGFTIAVMALITLPDGSEFMSQTGREGIWLCTAIQIGVAVALSVVATWARGRWPELYAPELDDSPPEEEMQFLNEGFEPNGGEIDDDAEPLEAPQPRLPLPGVNLDGDDAKDDAAEAGTGVNGAEASRYEGSDSLQGALLTGLTTGSSTS